VTVKLKSECKNKNERDDKHYNAILTCMFFLLHERNEIQVEKHTLIN